MFSTHRSIHPQQFHRRSSAVPAAIASSHGPQQSPGGLHCEDPNSLKWGLEDADLLKGVRREHYFQTLLRDCLPFCALARSLGPGGRSSSCSMASGNDKVSITTDNGNDCGTKLHHKTLVLGPR